MFLVARLLTTGLAMALGVGFVPPVVPSDQAVVPGEFLIRSPNGAWELIVDHRPGRPDVVAQQLTGTRGMKVVPNILVPLATDPQFGDQWSLENTGQSGGTDDADMDIADAWLQADGSGVVIAVIDSGVDLDHPDLVNQLWANPGEIAGNGIDDDANGYVDDVVGWDFAGDDNDPDDTLGHGTGVAGAAAAALNGVGTVGVAPGARIMVLRTCASSSCPMNLLIEAVEYARANGADVVNMSLAGTGSAFDPLGDAILDSPDQVFVAASGNVATDVDETPYLPAAFDYDNVISVVSTDHNDLLSGFSNFGSIGTDLAAPGEDVWMPDIGGYQTNSGTSFSAPHTAGVAALVLSLRPDLRPLEVRTLLMETADSKAGLDGFTASGGRLNAGSAVWAASAPVAQISVTSAALTVPSFVTLDGSESFDPIGEIVTYEWWIDGEPQGDQVLLQLFVESGEPFDVELRVSDDDGLEGATAARVDLNAAPTVTLNISDIFGVAPFVLSATVLSDDPDGDLLAESWALDGVATASPVVVGVVGVHSVGVSVSDGFVTVEDAVDIYVGLPFTDAPDSVFVDDIAWASATGLTFGCSEPAFCPDRPITRGEAAAFLTRWLDLDPGSDAYSDDDGHLFEADINALAAAEITSGCGLDSFCPDRLLERGQWAAFLTRALGLGAGPDAFLDDNSSIFEADINALASAGITAGCNPPTNDRFCPTRHLTRGEIVAMIHRANPQK